MLYQRIRFGLTIGGIFLLMAGLGLLPVQAGIDEQAGTSGGRFFKLNFGARGQALGGAYTASSEDLFTLQWNPASVTSSTKYQINAHHSDLLLDMSAQYVANGPYPVMDELQLSWFGAFFDKGTLQGAAETGGGAFAGFTGDFSASDWQIGLNGTLSPTNQLRMGATVKRLQSTIENFEESAWAVDAGFQYEFTDRMQIGASVENVGQRLKFVNQEDPLPFTVNAGMNYEVGLSPDFTSVTLMDVRRPRDNGISFHLGQEIRIMRMFSFRAGLNTGDELEDGLSFGAGFHQPRFTIDYAFLPSGDIFDQRQTFSMTVKF